MFLAVSLASFGLALSLYATEEDNLSQNLASIESLSDDENPNYNDAVNTYCINPAGRTGCKDSPGRMCTFGIFCIE